MGIQEDVKEIKEYIVADKNEQASKKFKLPFGKKVSKGQKKKGFVTVQVLHENGNIDFRKYKIDDQTFVHDVVPRLATAGHVMQYKNNPFIILPNWSVEPFSPLEHYQKSLINGSNSAGYKLLLAKMHREMVSAKPQMGGWLKWAIGIGLATIIGYALITGGG